VLTAAASQLAHTADSMIVGHVRHHLQVYVRPEHRIYLEEEQLIYLPCP
jgi:hypothetical protein